jgi:sugar transferase EpsL
MQRPYDVVKRLIDFVVAMCLLVWLVPILGIVSLSVLLAQGRPVIFRQKRPGLNSKPFTIYKFRTMDNKPGEAEASEGNLEITPLGRVLRSSSLDELPQLWNVFRGEMSLVGPRPLLTEYLPLYNSRQAKRHLVRPGLTGLAQVSGRNLLSWGDKLELDVEYTEIYSFKVDFSLLIRSLRVVVTRRGVSPDGADTMGRFKGS